MPICKLPYYSLQNLAPEWNERFTATLSDANRLHVKVYDYDRASSDDHLGHSFIDLTTISATNNSNISSGSTNNSNNYSNDDTENGKPTDIFENATTLKLELINQSPTAFPQEMGFIYLKIHIVEKQQQQQQQQQSQQQIQSDSSNMLTVSNDNLDCPNEKVAEEGKLSSLLSKR